MELPVGFQAKYEKLLGPKESAAFFQALKGNYQKGFRLNPKKTPSEEVLEKFVSLKQPAPYSPVGYYGEISGKTPLHPAGVVYSQEISAMLVAEVVGAKPGEKILDLCAAPGGKTTRLADGLKDTGLLVANEIFPKRAKILSENMERWGSTTTLVTNHAPHELVSHFPEFFDKILVDAPCSGEGMFQKEPAALTQWSEDYVQVCQTRQKEILESAVAMLVPGGELIYSTCTFSPEENEAIVGFLVEELGCEILPITLPEKTNVSGGRFDFYPLAGIEKTVRLWPHLNAGAGHFVARLKKSGVKEDNVFASPKKSLQKEIWSKEEKKSWQEFLADFPLNLPKTAQLKKFGSALWLVPNLAPSLKGLKLLRNGLYLGEFLKKRFVPSYSLALILSDYRLYPHVEITYEQWQRYVAGETLSISGNLGFVLVVYEGIIISFGKLTQGTLKNYFPKGLRFNQ